MEKVVSMTYYPRKGQAIAFHAKRSPALKGPRASMMMSIIHPAMTAPMMPLANLRWPWISPGSATGRAGCLKYTR